MNLFGKATFVDPMPVEKKQEGDFRLGEHLEDLRKCLIRIAVAVCFGWTLGWFFQPYVYEALTQLVHRLIPTTIEYKEIFRTITEPFMLKLKVSFYIGLIPVLPWCLVQIWKFIAPGLKKAEQKPFKIVAPISMVLFGLGAFFCWQVIPTAFNWFLGYVDEFPQTALYQEPGTLIFFVFKMMLAFGLGFQLPILVFFAARFEFVTVEALLYYWRHAILGIFVLSMVFVPTADPMSLFMLGAPLTLLYFVSVYAVKATQRKAKWPGELNDLD